ncbi:hypothetical protein, partial [Streptomyces anulatus]
MSTGLARDTGGTVPRGPSLPLPQQPSDGLRVGHPVLIGPELWRGLTEGRRAAGLDATAVLRTAFTEVLGLWSRDPSFTLRERAADGCLLRDADVLASGGFAGRAAAQSATAAPAGA